MGSRGVQLSRRGLEMPFEAGHQIEDDAVDIENHQLQRPTKQLRRVPLPSRGMQ